MASQACVRRCRQGAILTQVTWDTRNEAAIKERKSKERGRESWKRQMNAKQKRLTQITKIPCGVSQVGGKCASGTNIKRYSTVDPTQESSRFELSLA